MKKGIFNVALANIVCMALSLITNFLLPKYLSVESYAMLKTYSLYLTYAGFFTLGYSDSVYLEYGGKEIDKIDTRRLSKNFFNFFIMITIETVLIFFGSFVLKDSILVSFSIGMFAYNISGYLKMLFQATGEFGMYAKSLNVEKIIIFLINILLIFFLKSDNYRWYVWAQVIVSLAVMFYFMVALQRMTGLLGKTNFEIKEILLNIKNGYVLMLGNFSSGIFTGLDRWFVKFLLTTTDFAMYSFAVSTESVINAFISPITITMYNWFCKEPGSLEIKKIKKLVLSWGLVLIGAAFPAQFIIELYLPQYVPACSVLFFLIGSQVFYLVVKAIYVNLYKANKEQNKYFIQLIIMIGVAAVLNAGFYICARSMDATALATFCTAVLWMIFCEFEKKELRFDVKDWLYTIVCLVAYFTSAKLNNAIIGGTIYYSVLILFTIMIEKENCMFALDNAQGIFKIIKSKI